MRIEPDGEIARIHFKPGEEIQCESDAVVMATSNIAIEGIMNGGFFGAMARKMLSGETFFMQKLYCTGLSVGEAVIAPKCPGQVQVINELPWLGVYFANGSFLAAGKGTDVTTHMQASIHAAFSGTGQFTVKCIGTGPVAYSGFGQLFQRTLKENEFLMIDNGHVVAWSAGASYTMEFASKTIMSSMTSGEGIMCKFKGPGTVYIQSRNHKSFREWLQTQTSNGSGAGGNLGPMASICVMMITLLIFAIVGGVFAYAAYTGNLQFDDGFSNGDGRYNQRSNIGSNRW